MGSRGIQNRMRHLACRRMRALSHSGSVPAFQARDITNLKAYYKCDEASGDLLDAVNGYDLTSGALPGAGAGKLNGCRTFAAASSQCGVNGNDTDLQTGNVDFLVSMWVNLTDKAARYVLANRGDGGTDEWFLEYNDGADRFRFFIFGTGYRGVVANTLGSPSAGTWYHIVAWFDKTAGTVNISVNDGGIDSASTSGDSPTTTTGALSVGCYGGSSLYANASIDEVAFAKTLPDATLLTNLYGGGTPPSY